MNFMQQAYERVRARVTGQAPVLQEPVTPEELEALRDRDAKRRAAKIAELGPAYVGYSKFAQRNAEIPEFLRDQRQTACD